MKTRVALQTRYIFLISLIVMTLTILSVWAYGSGHERTVIENSFVSTSILFASCFVFLAIGLYKGVHVSNDLKLVAGKFSRIELPKLSGTIFPDSDGFDDGDAGLLGIIAAIVLWIVATLALWALLALFDAVIWVALVSLITTLYWIFFRALRLVFRHSRACRNNLLRSAGIAFGYSVLYVSWIYGLLFMWQQYRT